MKKVTNILDRDHEPEKYKHNSENKDARRPTISHKGHGLIQSSKIDLRGRDMKSVVHLISHTTLRKQSLNNKRKKPKRFITEP